MIKRTDFDDVQGCIIGEIDTTKRALLRNTATGELVEETRYLPNDQAARQWAQSVIEDRKKLWGSDFAKRYPKGFDLQIFD